MVYSFTQALENRTMESRSEMQMIEKLEELKDLNARHASGKFLTSIYYLVRLLGLSIFWFLRTRTMFNLRIKRWIDVVAKFIIQAFLFHGANNSIWIHFEIKFVFKSIIKPMCWIPIFCNFLLRDMIIGRVYSYFLFCSHMFFSRMGWGRILF